MANTNYSFFNTASAVSPKNSKTFIFVTTAGTLGRIETRNVAGKLLVTGSMAINGRSKVINKLLGTNYGDNDTVWTQVNIWEDRATRFQHMYEKLGSPDKLRLVIVGALSVKEYTKKDNTQGKSVNIAVQDWMLIPSKTSSSSPATGTQAPQEEKVSMNQDGFVELGEVSDDDLPF